MSNEPPTWVTWRQALAICGKRDNLRRTVLVTLIVGSILFAINQLDVIVRGDGTPFVWFKVGLTYLVPFCVSNAGILIATRAPSETRSGEGESRLRR